MFKLMPSLQAKASVSDKKNSNQNVLIAVFLYFNETLHATSLLKSIN
jgi:hypothetical protein